jgi:molybdenum cofactor synthesis domain-containing protein
VVAERGRVIDAGVVGAMASFGLSEASVFRRVRVRIITTGDEVRGVGERCEAWQLRDSNGPALHALLSARAWIDSEPAQRVIDDPGAIAEAVRQGVQGADAVILTGGVSMGDRDFVPRVVRELGGRVVFHKLPQRPGRPMLAAVMPSGVPVLGLPGNPVSVMVTARRIGVPVLASLVGLHQHAGGVRRALVEPDGASIDLWWHRLARERADGGLELVGLKGSGDLAAAAHCSGFVEVPPGGSGAGPWSYFSWDHD